MLASLCEVDFRHGLPLGAKDIAWVVFAAQERRFTILDRFLKLLPARTVPNGVSWAQLGEALITILTYNNESTGELQLHRWESWLQLDRTQGVWWDQQLSDTLLQAFGPHLVTLLSDQQRQLKRLLTAWKGACGQTNSISAVMGIYSEGLTAAVARAEIDHGFDIVGATHAVTELFYKHCVEPGRPREGYFGLDHVTAVLSAQPEGMRGDLDFLVPRLLEDFLRGGARPRDCLSAYARVFEYVGQLPADRVNHSALLARCICDFSAQNQSRNRLLDAILQTLKLVANGKAAVYGQLMVPDDFALTGPVGNLLNAQVNPAAASDFTTTIGDLVSDIFPVGPVFDSRSLVMRLWSQLCERVHIAIPIGMQLTGLLESLDAVVGADADGEMGERFWYYATPLLVPLLETELPHVNVNKPPYILNLVHPLPEHMPRVAQMKTDLRAHIERCFQSLEEGQQTIRELRRLLEGKMFLDQWAGAFNCRSPTRGLERRLIEASESVERLQHVAQHLEWLNRNGVAEIGPLHQAAQGVLDKGKDGDQAGFQEISIAITRVIEPLKTRVKPEQWQGAQGLTLGDFLDAFAGKVLFQAFLRKHRPRGAAVTLREMSRLCGKAFDMFYRMFCAGSQNLQEMEEARDLVKAVDVSKEVQGMAEFFGQRGVEVPADRAAVILNAFRHLQYLEYRPQLLELVDQYRLVREDDPDLQFLKNSFDEDRVDLAHFNPQNDVCSRLSDLLQHVTPDMVALFQLVRQFAPLREFLRGDLFRKLERKADHDAKKANITMQVSLFGPSGIHLSQTIELEMVLYHEMTS